MAGGKKKKARGRYTSPAGARGRMGEASRGGGYFTDRRLIPRIKEYMNDYGGHVMDIDEMALTLQAQYSDYARRKKIVFKNLVAKAYKSLLNNSAEGRLQDHSPASAEGKLQDHSSAEDRLQTIETNYLRRRTFHEEEELEPSDSDVSFSDLTSDSDDEFENRLPEGYNMMNDSLVHMYNNSTSEDSCFHDNGTELKTAGEPGTSCESTGPADLDRCHANQEDKDLKEGPVCEFPTENGGRGLTNLEKGNQETDSHQQQGESSSSSLPNSASEVRTAREKRVTFASEVTELGAREDPSKNAAPVALRTKRGHGMVNEGGAEDGGRGRRHKAKRRRTEGGGEDGGRKKDVESVIKDELKQKHSGEFPVEKSKVRFSDIGGCESCLKEVCRLLLHLKHPEVFRQLGVQPPQGFLLHGPPGSGKTLLACAIAGELDLPFIKLAATEVVSGVSGESEGTIRGLFQQAKDHAPCVLFLDEIDSICPKRETAQREMERRIVTQLLSCLDDLNLSSLDAHVLVIGATNRPDSLDPALRRAGRFDREISLGIPDERARESILHVLCQALKLEEGLCFPTLAHQTPGFVGADLMALVREASLCAVNRLLNKPMETGGSSSAVIQYLKDRPPLTEEQLSSVCITTGDFQMALSLVQPSAKREGFATVPDTTWEDIGALEDIREELNIAILAPVRYPEQFASLGLSLPPGILLAGPPGCGKTLLAKAIANETGINFISVKGPELLNMYVGESERAVRQVFQRARNSSPCIIFFDELDALCPKRSEMAESSASARVVNQLLTEMDGLETRKQVFIMAATNRPDIIDPAVLRPGRLDKVLYVGLPSAGDRAAILKTITKGGTRPRMDPDVDLGALSSDEYCSGFSGADLNALVREAAITALREHIQLNPLRQSPDQSDCVNVAETCIVSMRHFTTALRKIKPSVIEKDRLFYEQMANRFCRT